MHHPGPPRFTSVGERVELAPRDPDPDGVYAWSLVDRPEGSSLSLPDDPVVEFAPDVPGTYRVRLDAPDGAHNLTVRAFPDERRAARFVLEERDLPVPREEVDRMGLGGTFNDWLYGRIHPDWVPAADRDADQGAYVHETLLAPGTYRYRFAAEDEWDDDVMAGGELAVEGPGRPRLHLTAGRDGDDVVLEADASPPPDGEAEAAVEFYVDDRDRDGLARAGLDADGHTARVPVSAVDGTVRVHAVPVAERYGVADCVAVTVDGPSVRVERPGDPPDWIHDAVVYEIFVRAFAGDRLDATFDELRRRLDYLAWLGVDAVWLTPVVASPTRHGYHVTDYFETAADLGTREEFEALVAACHDRDIRVVFDLVINHTAMAHPHFQLSAAGVKGYRDWYVWEEKEEEEANPGEAVAQHYFGWESIPNVNYRNLDVRRHVLDVVDEWAPVVDGFRADVAWGVPHGFWKEVRDRVKAEDAEFLLLDETVPRRARFSEGEFDLHHDTDLYGALRTVGTGERPATAVLEAVARSDRMGFPESAAHLRYVENHDEDRYLAECGRDALRAAVAATVLLPGVPMLYYGQERGMTEYRGPMQWRDGDDDLTAYHRSLLGAYREHEALRRGHLATLDWRADSDRVVAFALEHGDQRLVVGLNFGEEAASVVVDEPLAASDVLDGDDVRVESTDDGTAVTVADAVVLRSERAPTGTDRTDLFAGE